MITWRKKLWWKLQILTNFYVERVVVLFSIGSQLWYGMGKIGSERSIYMRFELWADSNNNQQEDDIKVEYIY